MLNSKFIALIALSGCLTSGLVGCAAIDAMDAVKDMNASTKNMQGSTAEMNAKMDQTNRNMAETNSKIDLTNKNMSVTNTAIHLQTLDLAVADMFKPENTKYIFPGSPTPTSIMAAGKIFAETATVEELTGFTRAMMLEINSATPNDNQRDPVTHKFPQVILDKTDDSKFVTLTALEVIASFVQQDKIIEMVNEQILGHGEYELTAYTVLWLRHAGIHAFLLDEGLLTQKMINPGMFEKALTWVSQLKYIETRPFAKRISIYLTGFTNPDLNTDDPVDLSDADVTTDYYPMLKDRLEKDLDPEFKNPIETTTVDRMAKIKAAIEVGLSGTTPPTPITPE